MDDDSELVSFVEGMSDEELWGALTMFLEHLCERARGQQS